jgi:hypothetical protein
MTGPVATVDLGLDWTGGDARRSTSSAVISLRGDEGFQGNAVGDYKS